MSNSQFSTEAQQVALDLIISILNEAYAALLNKKEELELLKETADKRAELMVINIRLDTLGKVQTKLLELLKDQYVAIERYGQQLELGESTVEPMRPSEIVNNLKTTFVDSIMQGL